MVKKSKNSPPTVSIIIPVYNCEAYIQRCIDSVYSQTHTDFEVIAIDDGSVDGSADILRSNAVKHDNFTLVVQDNQGQGKTRNTAIDMSKGDFLLFLDSDDFIEPLTLELCVARIEKDTSDVVHFDWKLSTDEDGGRKYRYYNNEVFLHKDVLIDDECDQLMRLNNYFSVNNLYRKSFLSRNDIRFGEGYIYEDNPFIVMVANRASKISLIHSPLYNVQKNLNSTTRTRTHTAKHYRDHIHAIRTSFELLKPRSEHTSFYLTSYYLEKLVVYYERRVPRRYRFSYIKDFIDIIHEQDITIPSDTVEYRFLRLCIDKDVFTRKRYRLFHSLVLAKLELIPRTKRVVGRARKLKSLLSRYSATNYKSSLLQPVVSNTIIFLGFDFRYSGNSKFLFEQMISDKRYSHKEIKFLTQDEGVDQRYRLEPESTEAYEFLARAEIIIAESWIPRWIKKRSEEALWLQLWHGTPIKKMLFDSHEAEIVSINKSHKTHKYHDIQRWDYLVVDSRAAANKFATGFLYPKSQMLPTGYPRVHYLKENHKNNALKNQIKHKIGLEDRLNSKKLVLYAPTWRDYNYSKLPEEQDFDYVLNINELAEKLGEEYLVLFHDHGYMSSHAGTLRSQCIDVSEYDTQDLLLIADHVVSDYSSIIFDVLPCKTPISIYATDVEKYTDSRGVYEDIWKDLDDFKVYTVDQLAKSILASKINNAQYEILQSRYGYRAELDLLEFINDVKLHQD